MDAEVDIEDMISFDKILEDLDEDFLKDFVENIHYEHISIEQNLMFLHLADDAPRRLQTIINSLDHIKELCDSAFIDPLTAYIGATICLVESMHEGKMTLSEELCELLLLILDEFLASGDDLAYNRRVDVGMLVENQQSIKLLLSLPSNMVPNAVVQLIPRFLPRVDREVVEHVQKSIADAGDLTVEEIHAAEKLSNGEAEPTAESRADKDFRVIEIEIPSSNELSSFEQLAHFMEDRSEYWKGKTNSILRTALQINVEMNSPVDVDQLTAAVYMHDVPMALLPDGVLFKKGKYESSDIMLLQQHPTLGYELMRHMESWLVAGEMVQQHHERFDGNGYPQGLKGDEICLGAKIIMISDAYYSLTNARSDREFSRSALRALSEINRCNGTQFDPHVVSAFNHVISLEMMML